MSTFLNRLSQSAATRVEVDSAFAGTPVFHDGLAYAAADVLVVNYAGTPAFYQAGIGFTAAGEMLVVDASAGLPNDTFHQSGLPISAAQKRLCVDPTGAVVYWHQGVPFTAVQAVAVTGTLPEVTFNKVIIYVGEGAEQNSPALGQLYFGTSGSGGGYSSDKAAFLAAHPGLTLQDFSGIAPAGSFTTTIPSFTGFVFTSDGTRYVFDAAQPTPDAPFCFIWSDAGTATQSIILTFSPAINALGFQLASGNGPNTVEFYDGVDVLDTETVSPAIYSVFDTFVGYAT